MLAPLSVSVQHFWNLAPCRRPRGPFRVSNRCLFLSYSSSTRIRMPSKTSKPSSCSGTPVTIASNVSPTRTRRCGH